MPVSLKDVARAAGVSIKTVSNVVNEYPFVSEAMRTRVQAVLDDLGYRPNLSARRLRKGRSGLVALSVPELTPYFAELADHVIVAAEKAQLTIVIDRTGGERAHERSAAAGIRHNLTDGTIASPLSLTAEDVEQLRGTNHHIVLLGERLLHVGMDHVSIDNVSAARAAVRHLLDGGRTRIAALGTIPRGTGPVPLRQRGYEQALRRAGLKPERSLYGDVEEFHREDGYLAMRRLLQERPDLDAVFCFNDLLAFGALSALHGAGYRVPQDVALVGFDDVAECRYSTPALSSVSPDKQAVAEHAVRLLVQRMNNTGPLEPQEVFPPYQLVVRESSGPRTGPARITGGDNRQQTREG
jgi:DNA-binding LacI/PurR family transcriptional regulator